MVLMRLGVLQAHSSSSLQPRRWPTEEQAVPLQPTGTVWNRTPHVATEEPMGQQWMRSEGGIAHGEPLQEQQPVKRNLQCSRRTREAAAHRYPRWITDPEGPLQTHAGEIWEGLHPTDDPNGARGNNPEI